MPECSSCLTSLNDRLGNMELTWNALAGTKGQEDRSGAVRFQREVGIEESTKGMSR